eukprot:750841-Hanusia_phi.AAC.1
MACRKLGIERWPYRRRDGAQASVDLSVEQQPAGPAAPRPCPAGLHEDDDNDFEDEDEIHEDEDKVGIEDQDQTMEDCSLGDQHAAIEASWIAWYLSFPVDDQDSAIHDADMTDLLQALHSW